MVVTFLFLINGIIYSKKHIQSMLLFLFDVNDAEVGVSQRLSQAALVLAKSLVIFHHVILSEL